MARPKLGRADGSQGADSGARALETRVAALESAALLIMKAIGPEVRRHPYVAYMAEAKDLLEG